jgi:putative effector of murein hydrolase
MLAMRNLTILIFFVSFFQIMKCLFVVVFGFYFSASTTAYTVLAIRKMEGSAVNGPVVKTTNGGSSAPPKPFSHDLLDLLTKGFVLSGAASIAATRLNNEYASPIRTVFMIITTFVGYVWGARLPAGFVKVVHPIVTSTVVTHIITQLYAMATGDTFNNVLATYKSGSMAFKSTGAGDILLYLLGPAVVSFAISMYSRKNVIAENLLVVCTAMVVGSVGGLFGTAIMVRLLAIGGAAGAILRKSLLSRNITTPLAIPITKILNGDIPLACVFVVLTGIYGGTYGRSFMDSIGITDPVARGLGIGASAQGLGVASMTSEKEAFPFAAISMVLTAVAATVLVSIPSIKDTIVQIATGN